MFFQDRGWGTQITAGGYLFDFYTYDDLLQHGADSTQFNVHNHCGYEIQMIQNGSYSLFLNGREQTLAAGDVCVISPYVYHTFIRCSPKKTASRYSLRFMVSDSKKTGKAAVFDFGQLFGKSFICRPSSVIFPLIQQTDYEITNRAPWCEQTVQSLLTCIITYIYRSIAWEQNMAIPPSQPSLSFRPETPYRIHAMETFFSRKVGAAVSVSDLAKYLNLSPRQTANLIQEYYGTSFTRQMLRSRLENAKGLLLYTGCSIESISKKCGFFTDNYFYSCFKKAVGMTPRQYRDTYSCKVHKYEKTDQEYILSSSDLL